MTDMTDKTDKTDMTDMSDMPEKIAHEPRFTLHENTDLEERYYEATHPSGLTLLVCPKDVSTDYATLGVNCGSLDVWDSRHETPAGTAHFLEHKMFECPHGEDADSTFARLGAEVNAFTTYERTAYQITCTDRFFESLRELLTLVLSFHVTPASVKRERGIIAEEIRQSADSPYERCYAELLRALYHTHGVREEICGSVASIARITPAVLRRHYRHFYRPKRMILAVCGRVTPAAVWATVEDVLAAYEPQSEGDLDHPIPPAPTIEEPPTVYRPSVTLPMAVSKPLFCIGLKYPTVPDDPRARLRLELSMTLLSEMLFSRSGEWYRDLFESGKISPLWSYGASVGRGFAYIAVSGEADDPTEVYAAYEDYVARLHRDGLPRDAFHRSRRILYADYVTGLDTSEDVAETMLSYAADGLGMFDFLPTLQGITYDDVQDLFRQISVGSQTAISALLPMESPAQDADHRP